jgi:raffinose synthase
VLGLGLVHPLLRRAALVPGLLRRRRRVKVDAQNVIETLGAGHGGRGVARGLRGDQLPRQRLRLVHVPHHEHALQRQADRASDDFYPRDPASHTVHVSSVAYNTLCLGEFIVFVSFVDSF